MQVLAPISALLLVCAFLVSPGLFNIDEFVQYAGAKAFLSSGSFIVSNGLPEFSSPDLSLWILVQGPHGLTPQYPVGPSVLGAPLLALFGMRGLILINVLAGIGTLFALWALAKRHFGGTAVALVSVLLLIGGSFWSEYVFGIWPHSVGVFFSTLTLLYALDSFEAEPPFDLRPAFAAGATIGVGLLFRTGAATNLPAIGLAAFLFAKRPFRIGTFVALGLAPFVVLASAVNYAKFGTWNPLSYGQSGGNTDLAAHLTAIAGLAVVSILVVAARVAKWRPARRDYLIGLVALALVLLFSAAFRRFAEHYLAGAWALLVDATTINDPRPGVHPEPGGLLSFWGLWKKALGQSMPWLGLLFLAFHAKKDEQFRRAKWVVLILIAVKSLPFFATSWHGGMGSNMRYLLGIVPPLCALSARYLIDFAQPIAGRSRILLFGIFAGVAAVAVWTVFLPTHDGGAEQILSTWILLTVAALSLLSGLRWTGQGVVQAVCLGAIAVGLGASVFYMAADFRQAQVLRRLTERLSASAHLPDRTLAYVPPTFIAPWTLQPGHLTAMPDSFDKDFDDTLVEHALAAHYRVLVSPLYATRVLRAQYSVRLVPSGVTMANGELLEIKPPAP